MEQKNYIKKEYTDIIKGIGILLMIVLHIFGDPMFRETYPELEGISNIVLGVFQICVPIFAFLTGYFYFFGKDKSYKYSLKKIVNLWIKYLIFVFLFFIIAIILGSYDFSDGWIIRFILELVGLQGYLVPFCWYIVLYCIAMLLFPLYSKVANKSILYGIVLGVFAPFVILAFKDKLLSGYDSGFLKYVNQIVGYFWWIPVFASGFLFARYKIFYVVFDRVFKDKTCLFLRVVYSVCLIFGTLCGRYFCPNVLYILHFSLDALYAPMFIYGVINIVELFKYKFYVLRTFGKYSLEIWFFHGLFFNCSGEYTQKIIFFLNNPILITVWTAVICLVINIPIQLLANYLIRQKDKLIEKYKNKKTYAK